MAATMFCAVARALRRQTLACVAGAPMKRIEEQTQIALFQHARMRLAPGAFIFHVANQGKRSLVAGRILKSAGLVPGLPDVWTLLATDAGTIVRCIELKSERGRLSPAQRE